MPHISDAERRLNIERVAKLGNERSRVKHALQYTLTAFGIPEETQTHMLECVLDGNRMGDFEAMISKIRNHEKS